MMQISVWEFDQARALHRLLKIAQRAKPFCFALRGSINRFDIHVFFGLQNEQNYQFIHFQSMSLPSKENEKGQRTVNSQSSFLFSFEFMSHPFF